MIPRGALLNFATVLAGALLGLLLGAGVPESYKSLALSGLGLVTVGLGLKMFLAGQAVIIIAASIALGGVIGAALGISDGLASFADWARQQVGGGDAAQFNGALIATSVLFCVGPMTLLGCMQDALEKKIDLIALKSTLDGVAAFFFAATSKSAGLGVVVTALVVLVVQATLTWLAGLLKGIADDKEMLDDLTGTGGVILTGVGFGLLEIKSLPVADFLPALVLTPLILVVSRKFKRT